MTRFWIGAVIGLLLAFVGLAAQQMGAARQQAIAQSAENATKIALELASAIAEGQAPVTALTQAQGELPPGFRALAISAGARTVLAETSAGGDLAPPRRLTRDEKLYYDLAFGLATALAINVEEGARVRPEINVLAGREQIRAAAPFPRAEGGPGVVVVEGRPAPPSLPLSRSLLAFSAALVGFVLLGRFWPAGQGAKAVALARMFALAAAILGSISGAWVGVLTAAIGGYALALAIASGGVEQAGKTLLKHNFAYAAVSPALLALTLLSFFPMFYGFVLSLTDTTLFNLSQPLLDRFNGLANYGRILGDFQVTTASEGRTLINYGNFYWTLGVTLAWTLTNVTIGVSLGLGLALALNTQGLAFAGAYRTILLLPWAIPNYITALAWKGLFNPQFGAINQLLQAGGLEPVSWFDQFGTAFLTSLAANAWLSFPFMMVVSLGALQAVNREMYEAARLEGASAWRQFWSITLPAIRPALAPSVLLSAVWTFNMFNVIFLVSGGEPAGATEILITQAYRYGIEEYRYGYAAAYSIVIFGLLLLFGLVQAQAGKRAETAR